MHLRCKGICTSGGDVVNNRLSEIDDLKKSSDEHTLNIYNAFQSTKLFMLFYKEFRS